MDDAEREEYLHYIHEWYRNSNPDDVTMSLPSMEKHIMSTFGARLGSLNDPNDSHTRPFYHDFMEDDSQAAKFASVRSFTSRTRLSVRRVLGCGHFILGVVYMAFNRLDTQHGDNWPYRNFWQLMKEDLHSKELMNPDAPCDFVSTYQWLHEFYSQLFELIPEGQDFWETARIPFTMLQVRGPCERNEDVTTADFMRNYQEFLVFHLHNMHELGLLCKGPQLEQYHRLTRKRDNPPAESIPMSQSSYIRVITTTVTRRLIRHQKATSSSIRQVVFARGAGQTRTLRSIGYALAASGEESSYSSRENRTYQRTAGGVVRTGWHRSEQFQTSRWQRVASGLSVKVLTQHWRLGCNGCPAGPQRTFFRRTGRKRVCKWVTIRRTVLVRRMVVVFRRIKPRSAAVKRR